MTYFFPSPSRRPFWFSPTKLEKPRCPQNRLSLRLGPLPEECQFWGFSADFFAIVCHSGPFSAAGGAGVKPKFADKNYAHPDFSESILLENISDIQPILDKRSCAHPLSSSCTGGFRHIVWCVQLSMQRSSWALHTYARWKWKRQGLPPICCRDLPTPCMLTEFLLGRGKRERERERKKKEEEI